MISKPNTVPSMSSVTVIKLLDVDPRKIVNDSHSRIVTAQDVEIMDKSFAEHGYIPTASPISVRYATAPEICSFYQGPPYRYCRVNAEKLTASISEKEDFDGHVYAYDGLIRKAVSLKRMKGKQLPGSFCLRAMLVPQFSPRQGIAYGLAQNSINGIAVKLSPVEILIKCREYDEMYNSGRSTRANQTEVARTMVVESVPSGTPEETQKRQAETRRQIIGVSRKLPEEAIELFQSSLKRDASSTRSAYTVANMKAIPKNLDDKGVLSLLNRIEKGYCLTLPKPKPLDALQVKQQAALVLEASRHITRFQDLCGYENIPRELRDLCSRMTSTQKFDEELKENESSCLLFPPLLELCEKTVPGGDLRIKQVLEKLNSSEKGISIAGRNESAPPEIPLSELTAEGNQTVILDRELSDGEVEINKTSTEYGNSGSKSPNQSDRDARLRPTELPTGWHIDQIHFLKFEKGAKEWDERVSHCCDFAVMRFPADEYCKTKISKAVTHLGHSLHSAGVGHIFCNIMQYGLIAEAVKRAGMYMARDAALYVYDPAKVKRLTLSGQTQPIHQCAAVFWREPPSSKNKHYFSPDVSCPSSTLPGWVSLVTGLSPSENQSLSIEIHSTILRRWCQPGGLCYDATAGFFNFAVAAHELGIKYIGVEEKESQFQEGKKLLSELFSDEPALESSFLAGRGQQFQIDRRNQKHKSTRSPHSDDEALSTTSESPRKKRRSNEEGMKEKCALGALCRFKGESQDPSHACRCGNKLHNLCDYGRMFPRRGAHDNAREMEFACSKRCLKRYWPTR